MRNVVEQALAWALVVGLVCAVVLGRRRGKAARTESEANAYAAGYAAGGEATAQAYANQSVTVAVDASRRGLEGPASEGEHWCIEPRDCPVCAPVLHRVARREIERSASYDRAAHLAASYDGTANGAGLRGVPVPRRADWPTHAGRAGGPGRGPDLRPPEAGQ